MATPRPDPSLWSRLKKARIVQVLLIYIGASWAVMQVTSTLQESLGLPDWLSPVAFVLLLIGLVIVVATAWVQSHPLTDAKEEAGEVPGSWDVAVGELTQSVTAGRLPHLTWARAMIAGVVAFSILFGFAGLYVLIQDRGRSFAPVELAADEAAPAIAVLPFSVSGQELAVWREGMVDVLSTNLDGAAGLRAIDARTVLARWRESVPEGRDPELPTALSVARQTAASYALVGSAVSLGRNVRLSAEVYELLGGRELGRAVAEGPQDSVLVLVDRLSVQALSAVLRVGGGQLPALPNVASLTTTSLDALRAYLEGEALFRRSEFSRAIDAFERAVAVDSSFALALARISVAYAWSTPGSPNILAYLERALRFADRLPPRELMIMRGILAKDLGSLAGLNPLRDAVRRYPDDPEAWYQLGDTYFHYGAQALVAPEEALAGLERAVELDPSFDPYAIHVVQWAVAHADSAGAARLLEAQARLAPESDFHRASRVAFALVFGDSVARADAITALDTLPLFVAQIAAYIDLASARNLEYRELVLRALQDRPDADSLTAVTLLNTLASAGKLRAATPEADDRLVPPHNRTLHLYAHHMVGRPVEPNVLDRALLGSRPTAANDPSMMLVAAYAADRGRWAVYDETLRGVRTVAENVRQSGDSLSTRRWDGLVTALEGYAAWKRGRPAEALEKLTQGQRGTFGAGIGWFFWPELNAVIRWWLAELHLEMGERREAARYFHSLGDWLGLSDAGLGSMALFRLGQIYEELGEAQRARDAYQEFLIAWQDADAELPQKAQAEQALARLGGP